MAGRKPTESAHGTDRVQLRKPGKYWLARFTDASGKRREVGLNRTTNKSAAVKAAVAIDAALAKGEPWEVALERAPAGALTFDAFIDEWLEKGCRWSENTRRGHASILKQLRAEFGDRVVTSIRSADLEGYLARRRDEGMPPASRNRILAALKSIFKKAGPPPDGWGYVSSSPAAAVRMEREDIRVKDILDDDEFERLLAELPEPDRRLVLCAAETGMRRSELERLAWEDVDLAAGELFVKLAKNRTFRTVPLTDRLAGLLTAMRAEATPHPKAPVFPAVTDNRILSAALKRAGIAKAITLHTFRHQFATRALEAGVSSFHLQDIGGWKSPIMLERYGKRRNRALHAEMRKMDAPRSVEARHG